MRSYDTWIKLTTSKQVRKMGYSNQSITVISRVSLFSPPNVSLDGVLLYRCAGNGTSSGAIKLKFYTGILNGFGGHILKFDGVSTIWAQITGEKGFLGGT